jgi:hypothetical protein
MTRWRLIRRKRCLENRDLARLCARGHHQGGCGGDHDAMARTDVMISTRSLELVIDTVVCLTLAKWETVSGQFGGYLTTTGPASNR